VDVSASVTLEGMDHLQRALHHLPEELTEDARRIVTGLAHSAAQEIRASYAIGPTGRLKAGVGVVEPSSVYQAIAIVRSRARHARIYEQGTEPRQHKSGKKVGRMPAANVLIPIAIRSRLRMNERLIRLVESTGLFEIPHA
jgi:hypothetical protein